MLAFSVTDISYMTIQKNSLQHTNHNLDILMSNHLCKKMKLKSIWNWLFKKLKIPKGKSIS